MPLATETRASSRPTALVPHGPAARAYSSPAASGERPARGDPLRDRLVAEAARMVAAVGMSPLAHDVRLDKASDDIAAGARQLEAPPFELVAFLLGHYGIPEPDPSLTVMRGTPGAEDLAIEELRAQLPAQLKAGPWGRLGVGIDRQGADLVVVLTLQERNLELQPVPRRIVAGQNLRLVGRLLGDFRAPQVFVTNPAGAVREILLTGEPWQGSPPLPTRPPAPGGAFDVSVTCGDGNGRYQVEIVGTDKRGPGVVANFPVFRGVDPPADAPILAESDTAPDAAADPGAIEQKILSLVNRDRTAAGVPALAWDGRLAGIARAHSRDMAQQNYVGHVSPRFGTLTDRLGRAHLAPAVISENVGQAYSAGQAQRGFMYSPGHRGNVIDKVVTHVGIGVAVGPREGRQVPLFITQLFAAGL